MAPSTIALTNSRTIDSSSKTHCHHCGEECRDETVRSGNKSFCCHGCHFVHDLLSASGLQQYYDLIQHPGVRVQSAPGDRRWEYLDDPALQKRLLDFTDGKTSCITLHIPAIHCIACVWLLENLFRLNDGVGQSRVNFPRREVAIRFSPEKLKLSELVALLCSIGYEPVLTLSALEKNAADPQRKRQWLQAGIAGFAFGNIMLFSIPTYLGMDSVTGHSFKGLFGYLSLLLAFPVLTYSASDYWRAAFLSFKRKALTLDVPIALGIAALYAQSAYEIFSNRGEGYLDSLAGLIFFLLCGRIFQQKTHDRIVFDRDYKAFFPLSVVRRKGSEEQSAAISELEVGDHLLVRNGELVPADAVLINGEALIDYSFVTGESQPVTKQAGDHVYAGGQQKGGRIELEIVKPVSQSYLTSLWNHESFQKNRDTTLNSLTNQYSRRFTRIVLAVAIGAAIFWAWRGDSIRGLKAFTSVLIVACPCALALAAPFALGTAQRLLAKTKIFLKNGLVIENMDQIDTIVFDKTGTLTQSAVASLSFVGEALTLTEKALVASLSRHSTHPQAQRIGNALEVFQTKGISDFQETAGAGLAGTVEDQRVVLGSKSWLRQCGIEFPDESLPAGTVSYLAIEGRFRGAFVASNTIRPAIGELLETMGKSYKLALLSGDNERERGSFTRLFPETTVLQFNQSPVDKLNFIRDAQSAGKKVLMVGDGLNDAGALRQSNVGVAVVEKIGAFSPASDAIIAADQVSNLSRLLDFSHRTARVIRLSFVVSGLYNVAGISIAAAGILSPIICAILMPLSSLSVVLFACTATSFAAKQTRVISNLGEVPAN